MASKVEFSFLRWKKNSATACSSVLRAPKSHIQYHYLTQIPHLQYTKHCLSFACLANEKLSFPLHRVALLCYFPLLTSNTVKGLITSICVSNRLMPVRWIPTSSVFSPLQYRLQNPTTLIFKYSFPEHSFTCCIHLTSFLWVSRLLESGPTCD